MGGGGVAMYTQTFCAWIRLWPADGGKKLMNCVLFGADIRRPEMGLENEAITLVSLTTMWSSLGDP